MKQLYFIKENEKNILVSVDEFKRCKCLSNSSKIPILSDIFEQTQMAIAYLWTIDTDKDWEDINYEDVFTNNIEIIAAIKKEVK